LHHITVQEKLDTKTVDGLEDVSDARYRASHPCASG
jgi:hypothetical protein